MSFPFQENLKKIPGSGAGAKAPDLNSRPVSSSAITNENINLRFTSGTHMPDDELQNSAPERNIVEINDVVDNQDVEMRSISSISSVSGAHTPETEMQIWFDSCSCKMPNCLYDVFSDNVCATGTLIPGASDFSCANVNYNALYYYFVTQFASAKHF